MCSTSPIYSSITGYTSSASTSFASLSSPSSPVLCWSRENGAAETPYVAGVKPRGYWNFRRIPLRCRAWSNKMEPRVLEFSPVKERPKEEESTRSEVRRSTSSSPSTASHGCAGIGPMVTAVANSRLSRRLRLNMRIRLKRALQRLRTVRKAMIGKQPRRPKVWPKTSRGSPASTRKSKVGPKTPPGSPSSSPTIEMVQRRPHSLVIHATGSSRIRTRRIL